MLFHLRDIHCGWIPRLGSHLKVNPLHSLIAVIYVLIYNSFSSLGGFAKLRKSTIMFVVSVRPSVRLRMEKRGSQNGRILMKFDIWVFFFRNCRENSSFCLNLNTVTGTLPEDLCTFLIIYRYILRRMRKLLDEICSEYQKTHFMFNSFLFSPKIVLFVG